MSNNEKFDKMKVAIGEGMRRLPIYLLLDTSGSMSGAPIQAVQRGVEQFKQEIEQNTFAKETAWIGVITFGAKVDLVTKREDGSPGLVPVEAFQPPALEAKGPTPLGEALQVLTRSLDTDIRSAVKGGQKGDWKPLIFILTDGEPTDEWQAPRQEILNRKTKKILEIITVGCGPAINEQNLKAIAMGPSFKMDDSEASFKAFFRWFTQSVAAAGKAVSQPGGGEQPAATPAPPKVLQYIPP